MQIPVMCMLSRRAALVLAVLSFAPSLQRGLVAQTVDASILGTVHDESGAGLGGATVTAKNTATGIQWTINTNAAGRFAFLQLPLGGPYTVTARRLGYRPAERSGYELTLGSRVLIDLALVRAAAT